MGRHWMALGGVLLLAGCLAAPGDPESQPPANGDADGAPPAPDATAACRTVLDDDFDDEARSGSLWVPWEDGGTAVFLTDPGSVQLEAVGAAAVDAYADIWSLRSYALADTSLVADFSGAVVGGAQATFGIEEEGGGKLWVFVWDGRFDVMTAGPGDDGVEHCDASCDPFTGGPWRLAVRATAGTASVEVLRPGTDDWKLLASVPAPTGQVFINVWVWAEGDGASAQLEVDRLQWLDCG